MVKIIDVKEQYYDKLYDIHRLVMPVNDQMTKECFMDEFKMQSRQYFVAIDSYENALGYIGLFDCDEDFNIIGIATLEKGKGIGSQLIDASIDYARKLGKKSLSLEVDENNLPAIRFYEKHHFVTVARRKNYYKTSDALIMFLYL